MSGWGRNAFQFNDTIQQRGGIWQGKIPFDSPAGRSISRDDYSPPSTPPSSSHGDAPSFTQTTRRWSPPQSPRALSIKEASTESLDRVDSARPLDSPILQEKESQSKLAEMLYTASCVGDLDHIQLLLSLGAPVNTSTLVLGLYTAFKPAKSGYVSPLAGAAGAGQLAACEILLAHGAEINPSMKQSSSSPLHQACRADDMCMADFLLSQGADIDGLNCYKTTPLMYAAKYGSSSLVSFILSRRPDLSTRSFIGTAAIHWAIWPGHEENVELLLQAGADVDMRVADGATPLDCAASSGIPEIVDVLLRYGADARKHNDAWQTPRQVAEERGYLECAVMLREAEQKVR